MPTTLRKAERPKMNIEENEKTILAVLALGLVLYSAFFILDTIMYPSFKVQLFVIRLVVVLIIASIFFAFKRSRRRNLPLLMWLLLFSSALGITLMCVVVGEGFASPYYAGNILVIIASSAFLWFHPKVFSFIIASVLVEHFSILSLLPFQLKDLMKNVFFLGSSAVITVIIQVTLFKFSRRVKVLEGLIPICAKCKKIRDDRGYWNQLEKYIRDHSEAEFTHGLCPECLEELYQNELYGKGREDKDT